MDNYEIFLKVAETGNITRAAQILNYTQSGVSHAIAALEKETGFPVFVRSKTGVALTENAKEILRTIKRRIVSLFCFFIFRNLIHTFHFRIINNFSFS